MKTAKDLIEELIEPLYVIQRDDTNEAVIALKAKGTALIRNVFGPNSHCLQELHDILNIWDSYGVPKGSSNLQKSLNFDSWARAKREIITLFKTMIEDLKYAEQLGSGFQNSQGPSTRSNPPQTIRTVMNEQITSSRIFVVHGHDDTMKESVARIIERLGLHPIILHEQPNRGRTIIEKFTDYSNVGFAVILLSPDDLGYENNKMPILPKPRARQNVILEMGFFLGKLGRERVFVLYPDNAGLELPSDYSGVLYTKYDAAGHWQLELVQELKAVGYDVDANKLVRGN